MIAAGLASRLRLALRPWMPAAAGIVIPALVTVALFTYITFFATIPFIRDSLMNSEYKIVKTQVATALSIIGHYHRQEQSGTMTRAAAQLAAREAIRPLRYGDNEYFFIADYRYISIMHPLRPGLEGQSMEQIRDSDGQPFIKRLVDMAREKKEGFLTYMWYPKGEEHKTRIPKAAYVKAFEPWGWMAGSGVYIGDAIAEIRRSVRNTILLNMGIIVIALSLSLLIIVQTVKTVKRQLAYQNALQESESRFRALFMNSPDANLLLNGRTIIECNPATEKMLGMSREDILGKSPIDVSPPIQPNGEPSDELSRQQSVFVYKHGSHQFEWTHRRANGTDFWVDVKLSTILYRNQTCVIATWRDISERKAMEARLLYSNQELAAEKERLAVTLRSIGDGVITADTQGNVVILNKVAETLTGWSQQEAQGKPLSNVFITINEMTGLPCENPVTKVLASKKIVELENHTMLIARDGARRLIADSGAPILNAEGKIVGVVLVFRDMTEKQKLIEASQKNQKLESLGVLAGGVAHDFNNLLVGVLGNIELAKNTSTEPETIHYLDKALSSTERLRGLTMQLLTFARGGEPVRKLDQLGDFIVETTRFALSGSNVSARFSVDPELWSCYFDRNQIGQVIDNLVINAKQAMPDGGFADVSAVNVSLAEKEHVMLPGGDYIKISVRDAGCGIPREILPRIFDPFFTTKKTGNGLGLSTCHSIIHRHNGEIEVDSEPGKGSTFRVYLPATRSAPSGRDFKTTSQPLKSGRILVMDDDETIRIVFERMLVHMGYSVSLASDGREAVELFLRERQEGRPFDAVFLDLTAPGGMGGKEAVEKIRETDSKVPVFVASGYGDKLPVLSNPSQYGFTASLPKPFLFLDISELLNKHLSV